MELAAALAFLVSWLSEWLIWLRRRLAADTCWRQVPVGFEALWKSTLKNNGAVYVGLLRRFSAWCKREHVTLDTVQELDNAAARFLFTLRKAEGSQFVAALIKAYPPVRYQLPWTFSVQKNRAAAEPPQHHEPLSWPMALALAAVLDLFGRKSDAVQLLVQWRLGFRPGEALQLQAEHIFLPDASYDCGIVRAGVARGTKLRRTQFVRVYRSDTLTWLLLSRVKACRAPSQRIGRWTSVPQQTWWMRKATRALQLEEKWSAHSPRAGWATARHVGGQSVEGLMLDGRWASMQSLRVYLDAIGSTRGDNTPRAMELMPWINQLSLRFYDSYMWF